MNQTSNYDATSLEVLEGLEPVKVRPNMYTNTSNPNHLAQEAIDNAIDEVMAGMATRLMVTVCLDGSIVVEDNGRGIPVDIHPEKGVSGLELILSKLHAGAKFSNKSYDFSGGLHGVGISVANALSKSLTVSVKREGGLYEIGFEDGFLVTPLNRLGDVAKRDTGTRVCFLPDAKYFESVSFDAESLRQLLRAKALLCPGLSVHWKDEIKDESEVWLYDNGLSDYAAQWVADQTILPETPITCDVKFADSHINCLLFWGPERKPCLHESYVNMIPTPLGGVHVNGLKLGLTQAVKNFAELRNLLPKDLKLKPEDVWDHCAYVLSIKIKEPQFAGQTKERLVNQAVSAHVASVVNDQMSLWLNHQVQMGEQLVQFFIEVAQARVSQSKKVKRKKWTQGPRLPGKLTDCVSDQLEETELFLVEGDSAGGSARQAREKQFQAVLPLRGKILNTWELMEDKLMLSQAIADVSVAIGVDVGSDDLSGLRYGKICILTDADSDGNHICTLLCALFLKHFPRLVEAGHVYVAKPPLYRIDYGKQWCYVQDDQEKQATLERLQQKKSSANINIQRFKGLGEMNPSQLKETTMSPKTRFLIRLSCSDQQVKNSDDWVIMNDLMSKKRALERKHWLYKEGCDEILT